MTNTDRPNKFISDSITEQIHLLRYEDINGEGRLFGGKLVSWIDEVASTTAKRHAQTNVTTASIDNLQFKNPAFLDQLVVIIGRITYVGNTSLEVRVDTYLESMDGTRRPINRAYLTIVSLDKASMPLKISYGINIETDIQQAEWDNALKRMSLRKQRHIDGY